MYTININPPQNPVLYSYISTVMSYFLFLPECCQVKFTKQTNIIVLNWEDSIFRNVIIGSLNVHSTFWAKDSYQSILENLVAKNTW